MLVVPELHPIYEFLIIISSYLIISQIMDNLISPYIVGQKIKISPILLVISLILGITFFGLVGAIFAIPLVLVLKTTWEHYK